MLRIIEYEIVMLAIDLPHPFPLAFGSLHHLPRVLVRLSGELKGKTYEGVGEASIDFPFVSYDMWDVYACLKKIKLSDRVYLSFSSAVPVFLLYDDEVALLRRFPAALTALTMACDDLWGKAHHVSLNALTNVRSEGQIMQSIPFATRENLMARVRNVLRACEVPKIKLGQGIGNDVATLRAIVNIRRVRTSKTPLLSADFNGKYSRDEFMSFMDEAAHHHLSFDSFLTLEQPLAPSEGFDRFGEVQKTFTERFSWEGKFVADESVTTKEDAIACVKRGLCVNYKMQKIGGMCEAIAIADATGQAPGMVGGTFPTAIGRAYDLWAVASLSCATLPSDAWEPSTDWFFHNKHLVQELFLSGGLGCTKVFSGYGFGVTPDWKKIEPFILHDPRREYNAIRSGKSGNRLRIDLNNNMSYPELYRAKSGKDPMWNME